MFFGIFGNTLEQFTAQVLVRHFPTTKAKGDFDLVAVLEEFEYVAHFDVIVVRVRVRTELDLFDLDDLLLFARLSFFLLSLVFELTKVHDLADGRRGVWRNLDKIETSVDRHIQCAFWGDNAYIFAFGANETDFVGADAFVDAGAGVTRRWRVVWSAGYGLDPLSIVRGWKVAPKRAAFNPARLANLCKQCPASSGRNRACWGRNAAEVP